MTVKHHKKQIIIAAAAIVLITAAWFYRYYIFGGEKKKVITPATVEHIYEDDVDSTTLKEYQNEKDWQLIIVNEDNPIPEGYKVILTTLDNGQAVDCRIYPQLQKMFDDAREQNIYPTITSSFRTVEEQREILDYKYNEYKSFGFSDKKAEVLAENWVAFPGTSEHELGLAVDIASGDSSVTDEEVWEWLDKNSYKYGFVLRYTEEKQDITGIIPEEWHFRYVGEKAAEEMYKNNQCLEEYCSAD